MASSDLPTTWQRVKLASIARPVRRVVPVEPNNLYRTMGVKWWGLGAYERESKPGHTISATKMYAVKPGDLVINKIWVRHGSSAIVGAELDGCVVTADFPTFGLDDRLVLREWLTHMFKTEWFWTACDVMSRGTSGRQRIDPKAYLEIEIPLPPLDEQRRIIERIQALAGRIAEASTLQMQASEERKGLLSSAKAHLFESQVINRWPAFSLGDIADIRAGVTLGRQLRHSTVTLPYLRVANVQDGYFDLHEIKEVPILTGEQEKWRLRDGDILLTEGGDWDKLGRGAVWHEAVPNCIYQNHIFRVRLNPAEFDPEFVSALIGSPYGKSYFQSAAKKTTNLATVNQKELKALLVFRPPLREQRRIVERLRQVEARLDALGRLQESTQAELAALLPAVLGKAFQGEL